MNVSPVNYQLGVKEECGLVDCIKLIPFHFLTFPLHFLNSQLELKAITLIQNHEAVFNAILPL